MNTFDYNALALEALRKRDFAQAQKLFRDNSIKNPGFLSWNNLGWFYCEYGIIIKNGSHRSAVALGLNFLKKAATIRNDAVNHTNLGYVFLRQKSYEQANIYFASAYDLSHRIDALYNASIALFQMKKYREASQVLNMIKDSTAFVCLYPEQAQSLPLFIAFCHYYDCNFSCAVDSVRRYTPVEETAYDTVALYSLLKTKELIFTNWRLILQWFPTKELCGFVARCIAHGSINISKDDYRIIQEWCLLGEIPLDEVMRDTERQSKAVKTYQYIPASIKCCGFYGCKYHGNGYPL